MSHDLRHYHDLRYLFGSEDVLLVPVVGGYTTNSTGFSWQSTRIFEGTRPVQMDLSSVTYKQLNDDLAEQDKLYGGNGDDLLYGQGGDDLLYGEGDNDVLIGGTGNDLLDGGTGSDYLLGDAGIYGINSFGDDALYGGTGDDTLYGEGGNDWLSGDDNNDTLFGGVGADTLLGGTGLDILYGNEDIDYLDGGADADTLYGGDGNDFLTGGTGNDTLAGQAGDDALFGGANDDQLQGGAGNDVLWGGTGNDRLDGGDDNDTYIYNLGDGVDTIGDTGGVDVLLFGAGISVADLTVIDLGNQLLLKLDANNAVYIDSWNQGSPVDRIQFADGTVVTQQNFLNLANAGVTLTATTSSATTIGSAGDDLIAVAIMGGTVGTVSAGAGNDTYTLQVNANVEIADTLGSNTLVFGNGATLHDLTLATGSGGKYVLGTPNFSVTVAPTVIAKGATNSSTSCWYWWMSGVRSKTRRRRSVGRYRAVNWRARRPDCMGVSRHAGRGRALTLTRRVA